MFFNQQPRGFQQPLFPQQPDSMNQNPPTRAPKNLFSRNSAPPLPVQPQPMPQNPRQPIRMFAPPGTTQPIQGFNPLINDDMSRDENKLRNTLGTLFTNKSRTGAGAGATVAATGASIFTSINGVLDNVEKATQIAQNAKPALERFGPMIKNLPSLLKIYKEVNKEDADKNTESTATPTKETPKKTTTQKKQTETKQTTATKKQVTPKISTPAPVNRAVQQKSNTPKLYI